MNYDFKSLKKLYGIDINKVTVSAGLILLSGNRILLLKPTNSGERNEVWTIPKGRIDINDKNILVTACRETFEECGIKVLPENIDTSKVVIVSYKNKKDVIYKYIVCFIYELDETYLNINELPKSMLQLKEVEEGIFYDLNIASEKLFYKQSNILDYLKEVQYKKIQK